MGNGKKPKGAGPVLTERTRQRKAAAELGIQGADYDKSVVLTQLAILFARHRRLGAEIAFKGGAVLRMAHEAPRFSKDLDGSAVAKKEIKMEWLHEVLEENERRNGGFVMGGYQVIKQARRIHTQGLVCNAPSGREVPVSIEFNWHEPLLMPDIEWLEVEAPTVGKQAIPAMNRVERAAEKVRAFLDRALGADAYDLYFFGDKVLSAAHFELVRPLLPRKFEYNAALRGVTDYRALFDQRLAESERSYRSGAAVISGDPPDWEVIRAALEPWRELLP